MAIKAGLVGVNPKGVDKNGMPIGSGGGGDSYTKTESDRRYYTKLAVDQMLGSKVGVGQLTANNKTFNFAYDSTSEKYGYKLDGTGDFIPFDGAGAGVPGWNTPANPITTGLTYTNLTFVEGGYVIDEDGICILDMIVLHNDTSVTSYINGLPRGKNGNDVMMLRASNDLDNARGYVGAIYPTTTNNAAQTQDNYIEVGATGYVHYWGMYEVATT